MIVKREHDHDDYRDHDDRRDHDNDNDGAPSPPRRSGGALACSGGARRRRSTPSTRLPSSAVLARPMLQFKRDGDGTWMFGQKRTIVEDGSRWARQSAVVHAAATSASATATRCSASASSRSVSRCPTSTELPDKGFPWEQQWCVNLKCLDGADAGVEVIFKPTTVGGIQADRRLDRGGARPAQRRPARRQGLADRAARKGLATSTRSTAASGRRC